MGIDRTQFSQLIQAKIVYAGANATSYQQAESHLNHLANLEVDDKQVRRICSQIGSERCVERDAAAQEYQDKPLLDRKGVPEDVTSPSVAVVGVDGGRLQIFERPIKADRKPAVACSAEPESVDPEAIVEPEDVETGKHWREDKVALLMTMISGKYTTDPCPEIPENFVDPARIAKLAREFKKQVPAGAEAACESADPAADAEAFQAKTDRWEPPEVDQKQMVASRRTWTAFGPLVAAAAWQLGYFGASRKAFLGDGASNNWTLWRNHFSSFTPILDFIHALTYVFAAAMTGRDFATGWVDYTRWIQWTWQGDVARAIDEIQAKLDAMKESETNETIQDVLRRTINYLKNNCERMKYDEYRTQGLPINTSTVESTVKQINYRVKGTEKFWNEKGAEEILQLRADHLCDVEPMAEFWTRREASETGQNRYASVA